MSDQQNQDDLKWPCYCRFYGCNGKRVSRRVSLREGSRLGFMHEMRDSSGEAARAWGEVGRAGRRETLLLLL